MKIHHLNCVSSCPLGGRLMDGRSGSILERGKLCCHCMLLEMPNMLVLVDTGLGLRDVANPRARLSGFFLKLMSPDFREEMTAARQIEALGFDTNDVRHIVLTHLDFDHAGGLDDFRHASVHMLCKERDDAIAQRTWLDRQRFRPEQWQDRSRWQVYDSVGGDKWYGFGSVRDLKGLPPEILMVPLPGHTNGHAGIAIHHEQGWTLQAGDAYFYHKEMHFHHPSCTPGLALYQTLMEKNRAARFENQRRLRDLCRFHGSDVKVLCSHDPEEFVRAALRSLDTPVAV
jgi:glyoxylase-like metal-dependent hydrolase (beta-lactamase superfamily II)